MKLAILVGFILCLLVVSSSVFAQSAPSLGTSAERSPTPRAQCFPKPR
jgi:hypothetical protein